MKYNLKKEIWEPVVGYEELYEVSNLGRVRSVDRVIERSNGTIRKHNGKILKPGTTNVGYLKVGLYKEGKPKTMEIHKLVAITFLGHKPNGHNIVIDHVDHNPLNNRVDNLQLITNRENLSKDKVGSSEYTGVSWHKKSSKWRSQIIINGQKIYLGLFHNEEEASKMYQLALSNINKFDGSAKEFRELVIKKLSTSN